MRLASEGQSSLPPSSLFFSVYCAMPLECSGMFLNSTAPAQSLPFLRAAGKIVGQDSFRSLQLSVLFLCLCIPAPAP